MMIKNGSKKDSRPDDMAKKEEVRGLFNKIAHKYDYLNHFLSLGIDRSWRRKLRKQLAPHQPAFIIDVATGTADLAIELVKLNPDKIIGVDIADTMLDYGRKKLTRKGLDKIITLEQGDSENLRFDDNTFDAAVVSYGVRNFENPVKGMKEICRVLKPGGALMVLEFGMPHKFPVKQAYGLYFNYLLPVWGRIFSGSYESYKYLPESVKSFPYAGGFLNWMHEAGFEKTNHRFFTFGITYLYQGFKKTA